MSRNASVHLPLRLVICLLTTLPFLGLTLFSSPDQVQAQTVPPAGDPKSCTGQSWAYGSCTDPAPCVRPNNDCASLIQVMQMPVHVPGVKGDNSKSWDSVSPCANRYICVLNLRGICVPGKVPIAITTNDIYDGGACNIPQ